MEEIKGKIYVRFIDGINCYIPVPAREMGNDVYEIQPYTEFDYSEDSILFEFGPGDVVITSPVLDSQGNEFICADQLVSWGDDRNQYRNLLLSIVWWSKTDIEQKDLIENITRDVANKLLGELEKDTFIYPAVKDWIELHRESLEGLIKEY